MGPPGGGAGGEGGFGGGSEGKRDKPHAECAVVDNGPPRDLMAAFAARLGAAAPELGLAPAKLQALLSDAQHGGLASLFLSTRSELRAAHGG